MGAVVARTENRLALSKRQAKESEASSPPTPMALSVARLPARETLRESEETTETAKLRKTFSAASGLGSRVTNDLLFLGASAVFTIASGAGVWAGFRAESFWGIPPFFLGILGALVSSVAVGDMLGRLNQPDDPPISTPKEARTRIERDLKILREKDQCHCNLEEAARRITENCFLLPSGERNDLWMELLKYDHHHDSEVFLTALGELKTQVGNPKQRMGATARSELLEAMLETLAGGRGAPESPEVRELLDWVVEFSKQASLETTTMLYSKGFSAGRAMGLPVDGLFEGCVARLLMVDADSRDAAVKALWPKLDEEQRSVLQDALKTLK